MDVTRFNSIKVGMVQWGGGLVFKVQPRANPSWVASVFCFTWLDYFAVWMTRKSHFPAPCVLLSFTWVHFLYFFLCFLVIYPRAGQSANQNILCKLFTCSVRDCCSSRHTSCFLYFLLKLLPVKFNNVLVKNPLTHSDFTVFFSLCLVQICWTL